MATQSFMLKAAGLQTNFQSLMELPPGALLKAINTVINQDGIIEPRRGINTFYPIFNSFFSGTGLSAKQLLEYKGQILAHTSDNNLSYLDTSVGRFSYVPNATPIIEPKTGSRIRSAGTKGNLLITNSTGVKKISAKDVFDITNAAGPVIVDAGVPKAIAPIASLSSSLGWFAAASGAGVINKVAYRVLFLKIDNNSNTMFGSPSSRTIVQNPNTAAVVYNIDLSIPLPKNIYLSSEKYKVRIYRSEQIQQASGSLTEPSDELYQVYEADISTLSPSLYVRDVLTDTGRLAGVPLYTNQNSGEGILKSNDTPPSAKDLALFKGHMFYANTKTKDSITTTLSDITRLNAGSSLILTDGSNAGTETYNFNFAERSRHTIAITSNNLTFFGGQSIRIYSNNDERGYVFWFDETVGQTRTAPINTIPSGFIAVKVDVYNAAPTTTTIATAISNAISAISIDFSPVNTNFNSGVSTFNVTNVGNGATTAPFWDGSTGVTLYPTASKLTVTSAVLASYNGVQLQLGTRIAGVQKRYSFWMDGTVAQTTPLPTTIPTGFTAVKVNVYNAVPTTDTIATAISTAIAGTGEFTSIYTAGSAILLVTPVGGTYNPDTATITAAGLITIDVTTLGRGDTANLTNLQTTTLVVNEPTVSSYQSIDLLQYVYLEIFGPIATDTATVNQKFVVWFDTTGSATAPTIFNATLIKATINALTTTPQIANAISTALLANTNFSLANADRLFNVHYVAGTSTIQLVSFKANVGNAANTTLAANVGTFALSGLPHISVSTSMLSTASQVELNSTHVSIGTTVEDTARSIVKVINSNQNSKYVATYLSNFGETAGRFFIEKKAFDGLPFVITTTQPSASLAFSPNIGISYPNSSISPVVGVGASVVSSYNLGVSFPVGGNLTSMFMYGIRRLPNVFATFSAFPAVGDISKMYRATDSGFLFNWTGTAYVQVATDSSALNREAKVISPGTQETNQKYFTVDSIYNEELQYFGFSVYLNDFRASSLFKSASEGIANRLYYSKYQEHEAVPILNYIDIGSRDKEIQRIIQLRESLFILKDDGVYRLAGDPGSNPNWDVGAFDTTCIIKAPDTAITLNNQCYFFSTKGVIELNESTLKSISRPIDDKLLPFITTNANLPTVSFSASYESDKAFLFWTVASSTDTVATKCYRYNTVTDSWTEWDASHRCAIVNSLDDKLYFGSAKDNYIEVERKNFNRFDYVDRQLRSKISTNRLFGNIVKPTNFETIEVGDVLLQTQYLTIYQYNALLKKLDLDPGFTVKNFYSELQMVPGNTMTIKLANLAIKLNTADVSVNYVALLSINTDFASIQVDFNAIINALNNISTVKQFFNYKRSIGTISYEAIVLSKNNISKEITLNLAPPFIAGDKENNTDENNLTIYKGIGVEIEYAPQHAGDPSTEKQFSYGTFMFKRRDFRSAQVAYNSDVSDSYDVITINPTSSGIFGGANWGDGSVWGGAGDQAELITYIPLRKQRARFIGCKFIHTTALESFSLYGLSLTYRTYTNPNRTNR